MEQMDFSAEIVDNGRKKGTDSRRCPDTQKLKNLTGFSCKVPLIEGLKKTISWWINNIDPTTLKSYV